LGETSFGATAVESYLHGPAAEYLLGQDPARVNEHDGRLRAYIGSSMAGKQGRTAFLADYVASKFAVIGLTQAMAYELGPGCA
jgi:NAD(P)-dependent dehydrogenase (short-subunit alcohol dehydrogenase family)